jgi:hypothetical protein
MTTPRPADDAARRRRIRRFGIGLAVLVVLLVLFALGYVTLFDRVLRDPNLPPTVTSPASPRVLRFEMALGAFVVIAVTSVILLRRRGGPR